MSPEQILDQRAALDRTTWAPEVQAQAYEDTFDALWDAMRKRSDDQYRPLAAFPFTTLQLGTFPPGQAHARDITVALMTTPVTTLRPAQWSELLERLNTAGYRLEHSEWHHSAFHPADHEHAQVRSEFTIKLFVANASLHERLVVNGTLQVVWAEGRDGDGHHLVQDIDATHLTMSSRIGTEVFGEAFRFAPEDRGLDPQATIDPVLVYDLSGSGHPDIILPSLNTRLVNHSTPGHLAFTAVDLCRYPACHSSMETGPYVSAAIIADFNDDGYPDLVECGPGLAPMIYFGDGSGTFSGFGEPFSNLPADYFRLPMSITAGDLLGTGRIDAWIGQYRRPYADGNVPTPYYDANDGYPSFLLMNDGHGRLRDATPVSGLMNKRFRRNFTSSFVDLTGDGKLDLLTVNDFSGVDLYAGDGQGHFTEVTDQILDHRTGFGMSHVIADLNGDGALDLFVAGMGSTTARRLEKLHLGRADHPQETAMRMAMAYGNRLLLGTADHHYHQASFNDTLARTGWSWGSAAIDTDNSGMLDLYLSNGNLSRSTAKDYCTRYWTQDIYMGESAPTTLWSDFFRLEDERLKGYSWNPFEHKALLMNEGPAGFRDTAYLMDLGFEYDGREVVAADFDGDGHTDLLEVEYRPGVQLGMPTRPVLHVYRNLMADHNHWLEVAVPDAPNRSPLGATVVVTAGGRKRIAVIVAGDGYRSQHPASVHVGLGSVDQVDSVTVTWSTGATTTVVHPPVDTLVVVRPETQERGR